MYKCRPLSISAKLYSHLKLFFEAFKLTIYSTNIHNQSIFWTHVCAVIFYLRNEYGNEYGWQYIFRINVVFKIATDSRHV